MNTGNTKSQYSKRVILKALLDLMRNEDYSLITVSQICSKADVSRPTFYRNFTSKEDVLNLKVNKIIDGYISKHSRMQALTIENVAILLFSTVIDNLEFFRLLIRNNLLHLFTHPLYQRIVSENTDSWSEIWQTYPRSTLKNVLSLTFGGFEYFIKEHINDRDPTVCRWKSEFMEALNLISNTSSTENLDN